MPMPRETTACHGRRQPCGLMVGAWIFVDDGRTAQPKFAGAPPTFVEFRSNVTWGGQKMSRHKIRTNDDGSRFRTHHLMGVLPFWQRLLNFHYFTTRRSVDVKMRAFPFLVPIVALMLAISRPAFPFQPQCSRGMRHFIAPSSAWRLYASAQIPDVSSSKISSRDLRSIKVTNVKGEYVPLGDAMGTGTSVVVFLRHLGCTWCWSYVYQWKLVQDELKAAGIEGPIFVSIGDKERLSAFLLKNPEVAPDKFFVDGYDFAAYKKAGFGRFDEKPKEVIENVQPKPAKFGGIQGWWTFLTSFIPLAPVTPDMKFPENLTPEGLFWVGGTFVVKGDNIVYRWNDRISGDHPEASDVVEIAKSASAAAY